jgi:hypothetical protein
MIKRREKEWKERIADLVANELYPDRWYKEAALAEWVTMIDPYLLLSTPARLHQLFGKRKDGKWVLPLATARRLMTTTKWGEERERRLEEAFGDEKRRIGKKSLMQLEAGIDEGSTELIKVGLEFAGMWQKGFKIQHENLEKKAKELGKLASKYDTFTEKDVRDLKGNN